MIRLLTVLIPVSALGGCIIYDTTAKCERCDEDGLYDEDGALLEDTAAVEPSTFTLSPSEAAVGETFIASLTVEGPFDLTLVEEVEVFGGVEVVAMDVRTEEILMTLSIPATATVGSADILLYLPEDQVEMISAALTIVPAAEGEGGQGTEEEPCE